MNNIVKKLILMTILLSSTQIIKLPISNLSLFQISLIVTGSISLIAIIKKKKIILGKYLVFSLFNFSSSIIAFFISTNAIWAKSYFLLGIMTTMFIIIIPNFFKRNDFRIIEKILIRSQYLVLPFSIYSFYMFYFKSGIPKKIILFLGMHIELDEAILARAQAASQIRLTLPYSTPPILSVIMAMCIICLLFNLTLFHKKISYFLIICYLTILILTGSRTGVIALIFTVFIAIINKDLKIKKKFFYFFSICLILVLFIFYKEIESEYMIKFMKRFTSVTLKSLKYDRHLLVPIDGIIIWISSLKNFLLGIGFGSSINLKGMHTYLPPYFLNSFITIIVERGVIGLMMVLMLINLAKSLLNKTKFMTDIEKAMVYMYITGLISCLFYEVIINYFFIFNIAIGYTIDTFIKNIHNKKIKLNIE